jgi:hypothetical protein
MEPRNGIDKAERHREYCISASLCNVTKYTSCMDGGRSCHCNHFI